MSEPITEAEVAEWERLCREATPGPWEEELLDGNLRHRANVRGPLKTTLYKSGAKKGQVRSQIKAFVALDVLGFGACQYYNSAFIAASRTALPRLLAERKADKAELERLRRIIAELTAQVHGVIEAKVAALEAKP